MNSERHDVIVLRSRNVGEADKLVTVFSRSRGKIILLAKGIRRAKARLVGHLEPLSLVSIECLFGRSRPRLLGAELLEQFSVHEDKLFSLSLKFYFVELVDAIFEELDPHPVVFQGLSDALHLMKKRADGRIVSAFLLLVTHEAGYQAVTNRCIHCHEQHPVYRRFSIAEGGVVCDGCRVADAVLVAPAVVTAIAQKPVTLLNSEQRVLTVLLGQFLSYRSGRELKTRQLLRQLQRVR